MGRAITHENEIDALKAEIKEIRKDMKEVQDVVAELSEIVMHNTQVHHVDLTKEVKPTSKHNKTKSRKIEAPL